ncbi:variant 3 [Lathyrus oleraceus]|uniref:Variant 3 n=1 Tax=Pisum sativum TaxID=3888 RepID=A0A9D4YP32_PEA|nr:variant 3 [Pisum sativum]
MRIMICQVFVHGLIASSLLFVGRLLCISLTLLLSFAISNMPELRTRNIPKVGYPTLKAFAEFVTQFDMPSGIKLKKKDTDSFEFGRAFCPVMFEDHENMVR